jgi:hypothetical protein
MTTRQLNDIILDGGIRSIKFFNGRLLSGEDLSKEQEAQRLERRRLGQAVGSGVVCGLEISETAGVSTDAAPVLTITKGLAINRRGQTLTLSADINLSLVKSPNGTNGSGSSAAPISFANCLPPEPGVYVAGAGLWLLTIIPANTTEGKALVSGLGNTDAACNVKYTAHGVLFRLISLDLDPVDLGTPTLLRNRLAYRCFGIDDTADFYRNLFGPDIHAYGMVDALRPNRLTDCEVPLAIIYYTASDGLVFLDQWAVRRRVIAPEAATRWELLTGDRRKAEAEAMFWQFQAQLDDLRANISSTLLPSVQAKTHFRWLPAAGIVPLRSNRWPFGFTKIAFFHDIKTRGIEEPPPRVPLVIEGARVGALIRDSFAYPPIDIETEELIWVYHVRQNQQAIDDGGPDVPQPYVVFASGHMPYMGDPHYDVNRWNYANYW